MEACRIVHPCSKKVRSGCGGLQKKSRSRAEDYKKRSHRGPAILKKDPGGVPPQFHKNRAPLPVDLWREPLCPAGIKARGIVPHLIRFQSRIPCRTVPAKGRDGARCITP